MATTRSLEELSRVVIKFGEHSGKTLDQVPLGYLDKLRDANWLWQSTKKDINEYLEHPTIRQELDRELT